MNFLPFTRRLSVLRLNFWAVRSAFRMPSRTKCRSVLLAIFRRKLSFAICFSRFYPFFAMQCGLFKKTEVFCAFLSVGGLLPEDSILKERLVLFQLIEWTFGFQTTWFKPRLLFCAFPKEGEKWFRFQLRNVSRFHIFGAAFYRSSGRNKCRLKTLFEPNIFSGLYSPCINPGY